MEKKGRKKGNGRVYQTAKKRKRKAFLQGIF